jgi:hypothetical protein
VSPGASQVFAYYRVRPADALAVVAAVRALHDTLQAAMPGLVCTLSRRADSNTELLTLMETYSHADGVDEVWQRSIECSAREALTAWVVGERHVEVFVPCA